MPKKTCKEGLKSKNLELIIGLKNELNAQINRKCLLFPFFIGLTGQTLEQSKFSKLLDVNRTYISPEFGSLENYGLIKRNRLDDGKRKGYVVNYKHNFFKWLFFFYFLKQFNIDIERENRDLVSNLKKEIFSLFDSKDIQSLLEKSYNFVFSSELFVLDLQTVTDKGQRHFGEGRRFLGKPKDKEIEWMKDTTLKKLIEIGEEDKSPGKEVQPLFQKKFGLTSDLLGDLDYLKRVYGENNKKLRFDTINEQDFLWYYRDKRLFKGNLLDNMKIMCERYVDALDFEEFFSTICKTMENTVKGLFPQDKELFEAQNYLLQNSQTKFSTLVKKIITVRSMVEEQNTRKLFDEFVRQPLYRGKGKNTHDAELEEYKLTKILDNPWEKYWLKKKNEGVSL